MLAKQNHLQPDAETDADSARDSAEYIASLADQLRRMAEANGHDFLAYLIDMVVIEAWRIAGPDPENCDQGAESVSDYRS